MDIEKVKRNLQTKENHARQKKQDELQQIKKDLRNLSAIWEKYNIKRVYLYGSVARARTHQESDIDVAVEGDLGYKELLHLFAEVDKHLTRPIDLRNLEEIPFKDTIREKGVLVYEH